MTATPGRCPRCSTALAMVGRMRICRECKGLWLTEPEIADRIRERCPGDRGELVFVESDGTALPCPACSEPMAACFLEGVPLDRCQTHGVWFDVDELERTLKAARVRRPAVPAPVAVVAGAVPADSAVDPETGWVVLEVLGDVLCAVVEITDW